MSWLGTIIGFLGGLGLFIYAVIMGGASNPMVFIHPNSFLMVIGGTIAATFIAFLFSGFIMYCYDGMIIKERQEKFKLF